VTVVPIVTTLVHQLIFVSFFVHDVTPVTSCTNVCTAVQLNHVSDRAVQIHLKTLGL